jgi:predicted transcriptional regulator
MNVSTDLAVTQSFTLTIGHIAKLSEMALKLDMNKSEIVRQAIDKYFEWHADELRDMTITR